jgi:hypothetical protein
MTCFGNFVMDSWKLLERFGDRFFSQSNSDYIGLKIGLDAESGEDPIEKRPSASLFMRSFSLNAWSWVTFVLLIMLLGGDPNGQAIVNMKK